MVTIGIPRRHHLKLSKSVVVGGSIKAGRVVSPLTPESKKKRKAVPQTSTGYATTSRQATSFSLYVGENFAVQMPFSLNMKHLVSDVLTGGFVTTKFYPHHNIDGINLSTGGLRLLSVPNAGGSSVVSEVLSFEVLERCFGAKLKKTEMEVTYFPYGGSITDYMCELSTTTVGVSVTRAMKYHGEFSLEDAVYLLNKKLKGVLQATENSLEKWVKQILHVWSASDSVTRLLHQAYSDLDLKVKANTVVLVTTASSADYIFTNG